MRFRKRKIPYPGTMTTLAPTRPAPNASPRAASMMPPPRHAAGRKGERESLCLLK